MRDFTSHGVVVCTSSSNSTSNCKQAVEEKADVGVIGNEGKLVCTFGDKSHGRQPCAPYQEGCFVGAKPRGIMPRAFCF